MELYFRRGDLSILEEINQVVQVPMKFIHVHRNPFDNIATMMLRSTGSRDAVRKEGVKVRRRLWCFWHSCCGQTLFTGYFLHHISSHSLLSVITHNYYKTDCECKKGNQRIKLSEFYKLIWIYASNIQSNPY